MSSVPSLLVAAVAADGLRHASLPLPQAELGAEQWATLLAEVRSQRLAGLLVQAIGAGRMPVSAPQREAAIDLHERTMSLALALERTLLHAIAVLDQAGIASRVLKGPATAHLDYEDPGSRVFHDVDVLVPSTQFCSALDALFVAGYRRRQRRLGPVFDATFAKGATLVDDEGRELDLHRNLVAGRFGLSIGLVELFQSFSTFQLAGQSVLALGPEERFLHACYSAAVADPTPRLVSLRDVAQMLGEPALDLDRAWSLCRSWDGEAVLASAVATTHATFGLTRASTESLWAQRYRPTPGERRALHASTTRRSASAQALTSLPVLPGLGAKIQLLRCLAFPERAFLASTSDPRRRTWWARGLRSALRLPNGPAR